MAEDKDNIVEEPKEEKVEKTEPAPTGKFYAKKGDVIGPDGEVVRSYTKKIHDDPEEAAKGFATKMNAKLAGAHK